MEHKGKDSLGHLYGFMLVGNGAFFRVGYLQGGSFLF